MQDAPVRIFVSYAHEDEAWRRVLFETAVDMPDGVHPAWTDDRILPGSDWDEAIGDALREATVAILLVSRQFLKSVYISRRELPALLRRRLSDGLKRVWSATSAASRTARENGSTRSRLRRALIATTRCRLRSRDRYTAIMSVLATCDARRAFVDIGPKQYAILENAIVELFAFYEQEHGRHRANRMC